jgi:hypothetical protein
MLGVELAVLGEREQTVMHVGVLVSSAKLDTRRYYLCQKCGFSSLVGVATQAEAQVLAVQSRALLSQRLKETLELDEQRLMDMVPCPGCGARKDVSTHHRRALFQALFLFPLLCGAALVLAALLKPVGWKMVFWGWIGVSIISGSSIYFRHHRDRRRALSAVAFDSAP